MSLHLQRHECVGKAAIKAEWRKQQEEEFVPTGTSEPSDFILRLNGDIKAAAPVRLSSGIAPPVLQVQLQQ